MKGKICILNDLNLSIVVLMAPHNFFPVPPVPPVPPPMLGVPYNPFASGAIEFPLVMLHLPGNALGKNKYSTTVTHKNLGIIQAGHDLGPLIGHVHVVPGFNNILSIVQMLFSSRKVMFSASTVKVQGQPAALAGLIGWPPTPMMICSDPMGLPIGEVPTRWLNTVEVGVTLADFLLGLAAVAASMIVDWIFKAKLGDLASPLGSQLLGKMMDAGSFLEWGVKQGVGFALGLAQIAVTGQGSATIGFGGPWANVGLSVTADANGNVQVALQGQIPVVGGSVGYDSTPNAKGQAAGFNAQGNYNYGWGGGAGTVSQNGDDQVSTHNTSGGKTTGEQHSRVPAPAGPKP